MVIKYGDEMWNCSELERKVSSLRSKDLVFYGGDMLEVETVQRDCIDFHNHSFVMVIARSATGEQVSFRNGLGSKTTCWRKRKKVS